MKMYCCKLDLDIEPLINSRCFNIKHSLWSDIPIEAINPELKIFLHEKELTIFRSEIFVRGIGDDSDIHIDGKYESDLGKINFIYQGKQSVMSWYKPKLDKSSFSINDKTSSSYIEYDQSEVELLHSEENMDGCYLVQTGIPHVVRNPHEIRYCICIVPLNKKLQRPTFNELKEKFEDILE